MTNIEIQKKIKELLIKKNAILLAHYYQTNEIQEIANYVGDSLGLSQKAKNTSADIIIFAGVVFMAETAKILNPFKRVFIPDINAGCSLADSCDYKEFTEFIKDYQNYTIISYINCSSEIKAMSDIIITSGNALKIIDSLPKNKKIIFTPDRNLGNYINNKLNRNMILWNGTCHVHEIIKASEIIKLKAYHPEAKLLAHPECNGAVLNIADYIGSTTEMINFSKQDKCKKYIVASETGILFAMKNNSPDKEFIIIPSEESCSCNDCNYMKLNTLEKILDCLENENNEIFIDKDLALKALKPINKMLDLSKQLNII